MNFTREPIIETIITPKEGYKLVVRNTKGIGQEEHFVDAVEVVSFGHSFFFRSLERPKPFLVPVTDYEIVEVKETRVVLKNASIDRAIKIGGGRDASMRPSREPVEKIPEVAEAEQPAAEEALQETAGEQRLDKKRDRRRHRRRRGGEDRYEGRPIEEQRKQPTLQAEAVEGGGANDEAQVSSSMFSTLFPPPPTLISETIGRYKDMAFSEGNLLPKPVEEPQDEDAQPADEEAEDQITEREKHERKKDDDDDDDENNQAGSDSQPINRISTVSYEEVHFSSPASYTMRPFLSEDSFFIP